MLQVSVAQKLFFVQLLIYSLFLETAIQLFLQAFANGLKEHMIKLEFWITFFIFLMNEYSGFSFELNIESYKTWIFKIYLPRLGVPEFFTDEKNFFLIWYYFVLLNPPNLFTYCLDLNQ